jgi:hypothetical protein
MFRNNIMLPIAGDTHEDLSLLVLVMNQFLIWVYILNVLRLFSNIFIVYINNSRLFSAKLFQKRMTDDEMYHQ